MSLYPALRHTSLFDEKTCIAARCSHLAIEPTPRIPPATVPKATAIAERLKQDQLRAIECGLSRHYQHALRWSRCALGLISWILHRNPRPGLPDPTIEPALALNGYSQRRTRTL
jgi:hypothetical protein